MKRILNRYQRRYGDRDLQAEKSWKNTKPLENFKERKDSTRLDVYDTKGQIVYDYKYIKEPGTGLGKKQIEKIITQGPKEIQKIVEVNPTKIYKSPS